MACCATTPGQGGDPSAGKHRAPPPVAHTDLDPSHSSDSVAAEVGAAQARQILLAAGIPPERLRCNTKVLWAKSLKGYADNIVAEIAQSWGMTPTAQQLKQAQHQALGYLVRSYFEEANMHNLGVMRLKGHSYRDSQGREQPLLVFRSGLIVAAAAATACVTSLLEEGRVRHVINLYAGTFPFRDVIEQEKRFVRRFGATYYDDGAPDPPSACWRKLVEDEGDYAPNRDQAQRLLAQLIRNQVLRPGGKPPRGNIYLHCGGGMHRSGMVFGIMRRCINNDPFPEIQAEYARHVGWRSDDQPGGFEALNLRFIGEFDCSLLAQPRADRDQSVQKTAGN